MRNLTNEEMDLAGGGDQAGVGAAFVLAPIGIAGSSGVTGGACVGIGAGGVVTGVGVVTVALPVAVAVGGVVLGNAIGNSAPVQSFADGVGTWLGEHGIVW